MHASCRIYLNCALVILTLSPPHKNNLIETTMCLLPELRHGFRMLLHQWINNLTSYKHNNITGGRFPHRGGRVMVSSVSYYNHTSLLFRSHPRHSILI